MKIMTNSFKYYNHAYIPTCEPREVPDITCVEDNTIFAGGGILARWTTDFDNPAYREWWYVIKDTPFDINSLKSKRRYEINKGNKFFDVRIINPSDHVNEIYNIQSEAFAAYPKKYRPDVKVDNCIREVASWIDDHCIVYGAFFHETNAMCGYAAIRYNGKCIEFFALKTCPSYEKYAINAALVYKLVSDCNSKLAEGYYICDGARNIIHETGFQNYLEKYFDFRKAFCRLWVEYNPKYKYLIKFLFIFRKLLKLFNGIGIVHKINGILTMESIVRNQNKEHK